MQTQGWASPFVGEEPLPLWCNVRGQGRARTPGLNWEIVNTNYVTSFRKL